MYFFFAWIHKIAATWIAKLARIVRDTTGFYLFLFLRRLSSSGITTINLSPRPSHGSHLDWESYGHEEWKEVRRRIIIRDDVCSAQVKLRNQKRSNDNTRTFEMCLWFRTIHCRPLSLLRRAVLLSTFLAFLLRFFFFEIENYYYLSTAAAVVI